MVVVGLEWRRFSERRRDDDRREGLVVEMAFSMVWRAKFRGVMRLVGSVLRRMEER